MIFLMQFGINKHLLIFSKTTNCTHPTGSYNFVSLKKNLLVLIYRNHVTTYTNCTMFCSKLHLFPNQYESCTKTQQPIR